MDKLTRANIQGIPVEQIEKIAKAHYVAQMNGNNDHCSKISSWNITGMRKLAGKGGITYLQNEN